MTSSGTPSASAQSPRRTPADAIVGALIGPVFLGVAIWFLAGGTPADVPVSDPVMVSRADIAWPLRPLPNDPPTIEVAGFSKKCMECHSLFRSAPDTPLRLSQHRDIVQGHGMNDRCFNCHDNEDRNSLVLPGGRTIGFREAPRLCAACHGTTYRDWQRGMHGRTIGSWDPSRPQHALLTCTQCHDPHAPAFDDMIALPGPDTLRMGDPHEPVHDPTAKRNPLRQWSGGARHEGTEVRRHDVSEQGGEQPLFSCRYSMRPRRAAAARATRHRHRHRHRLGAASRGAASCGPRLPSPAASRLSGRR